MDVNSSSPLLKSSPAPLLSQRINVLTTASLMTEFYQRLQQGNDKASGLRQAMLTTMKQHPDPKDWAAFTLIGESN